MVFHRLWDLAVCTPANLEVYFMTRVTGWDLFIQCDTEVSLRRMFGKRQRRVDKTL